MGKRWRLILPVYGLLLFSIVSYDSFQRHQRIKHPPDRYFWWGSLRLDATPPGRHMQASPPDTKPCKNPDGCIEWDPISILVHPGTFETLLVFSALPAYVLTSGIVITLGRFGISEVLTFMIAMPLLTVAWFYFVGWLLNRRRHRQVVSRASYDPSAPTSKGESLAHCSPATSCFAMTGAIFLP
jgi:hypothetical protein